MIGIPAPNQIGGWQIGGRIIAQPAREQYTRTDLSKTRKKRHSLNSARFAAPGQRGERGSFRSGRLANVCFNARSAIGIEHAEHLAVTAADAGLFPPPGRVGPFAGHRLDLRRDTVKRTSAHGTEYLDGASDWDFWTGSGGRGRCGCRGSHKGLISFGKQLAANVGKHHTKIGDIRAFVGGGLFVEKHGVVDFIGKLINLLPDS